ncbi:MAG: hypothetical protein ACLFQK_02445 [Fibrobacterota bacterium]
MQKFLTFLLIIFILGFIGVRYSVFSEFFGADDSLSKQTIQGTGDTVDDFRDEAYNNLLEYRGRLLKEISEIELIIRQEMRIGNNAEEEKETLRQLKNKLSKIKKQISAKIPADYSPPDISKKKTVVRDLSVKLDSERFSSVNTILQSAIGVLIIFILILMIRLKIQSGKSVKRKKSGENFADDRFVSDKVSSPGDNMDLVGTKGLPDISVAGTPDPFKNTARKSAGGVKITKEKQQLESILSKIRGIAEESEKKFQSSRHSEDEKPTPDSGINLEKIKSSLNSDSSFERPSLKSNNLADELLDPVRPKTYTPEKNITGEEEQIRNKEKSSKGADIVNKVYSLADEGLNNEEIAGKMRISLNQVSLIMKFRKTR